MKRKFHCYTSWNISWKHSFSVAQHSSCKREHVERICNYVYRKLFSLKLLHEISTNCLFCLYLLIVYICIIWIEIFIKFSFDCHMFLIQEISSWNSDHRCFSISLDKTVAFERRLKNKEKLKLQKKVEMKEITKRVTT